KRRPSFPARAVRATDPAEGEGPPRGRPSVDDARLCDQCLVASLTASFTSPTALCASPLTLSTLPSASRPLSPVTLPAASFTAPLALSAAPFTCSLSIGVSWVVVRKNNDPGRREVSL